MRIAKLELCKVVRNTILAKRGLRFVIIKALFHFSFQALRFSLIILKVFIRMVKMKNEEQNKTAYFSKT